jgi:hypothetical protein
MYTKSRLDSAVARGPICASTGLSIAKNRPLAGSIGSSTRRLNSETVMKVEIDEGILPNDRWIICRATR